MNLTPESFTELDGTALRQTIIMRNKLLKTGLFAVWPALSSRKLLMT